MVSLTTNLRRGEGRGDAVTNVELFFVLIALGESVVLIGSRLAGLHRVPAAAEVVAR